MKFDYNLWRVGLDSLMVLSLVGSNAYTWWVNRERVTRKRFEALEKDVAQRLTREDAGKMVVDQMATCPEHRREISVVKTQVDRIGGELRQLPQRHELEHLHVCIKTLSDKISNLDGKFSGVDRLVDMLTRFQVEKGNRS